MEKLAKYLGMETLGIAPMLSLQDGIQAARTALARSFFDHKTNPDTYGGVEALRQYQREYNEDKRDFMVTPLRNWATHAADAYRMLAVAERVEVLEPAVKRLSLEEQLPNIHQMTLDELWDASERAQTEYRPL
jgi:hypothetical protein